MEFLAERAWMMALDLRASGFDKLSVVDAGRASRHASHAAEAGVKVADPLRVYGRATFAGKFHQINAATRRVHLFVPENVSGAHWQTEAAVDAVLDDLVRRRVVRIEGARQWI